MERTLANLEVGLGVQNAPGRLQNTVVYHHHPPFLLLLCPSGLISLLPFVGTGLVLLATEQVLCW